MTQSILERDFERLVKNTFDVYNSLFLNLPYEGIRNIGILLPLLAQACERGLQEEKAPAEILDGFFGMHTGIATEQEKIDFMFKVVQYVERQIVLFDSVEDAAFIELQKHSDDLPAGSYIRSHVGEAGARLRDALSAFSTRIVLTAHPTQFYSRSALDIMNSLRSRIRENDISGIDMTLQQLGLTSLVNRLKPTPYDEARNIIYYLEHVYYDAMGDLYARIKQAVSDRFDNPGIVQLGFWPGGDRDGNPFVTAETTMRVADELRLTLMRCYHRDIERLSHKLTFRDVESLMGELSARLYSAMHDAEAILRYEDIRDTVARVRQILADRYHSLYLEDVDHFLDMLGIFRTHFAALDIRQNHRVHEQVVEEILRSRNLLRHGIGELSEDDLMAILLRRSDHVTVDDVAGDLVRETVRNIAQLKTIQARNGESGCHRYIVSNAEDVFSVLYVMALLRWCCWPDNEHVPMDVVPLIESMRSMEHAESILGRLFELPEYRAHLRQRRDTQTVMLGFSDGTKDGGYLQANWSIHQTKERLSALCDRHGIKVLFFDGRGGPPARGGGQAHRFYASQSGRIANHAIHITIQGQTITSKFGTKAHFIHHAEQLLTAGLAHRMRGRENTIPERSRRLIDRMAHISHRAYDELKRHPMFIPYLEHRSALTYLGEANVGSRPDRRGHTEALDLDDLRAIPFVSAWSQLKQNVPGFYGVGTAMNTLAGEGKMDELKELFAGVPFFKALMQNSMMSMSKCNYALTRHVARDERYREFWNMLFGEFELTKRMLLDVSGFTMLMQEEPVSRRSIEIREKIMLPLLVMQQFALLKAEQGGAFQPLYEKLVRRSVYGIINASRNSA